MLLFEMDEGSRRIIGPRGLFISQKYPYLLSRNAWPNARANLASANISVFGSRQTGSRIICPRNR